MDLETEVGVNVEGPGRIVSSTVSRVQLYTYCICIRTYILLIQYCMTSHQALRSLIIFFIVGTPCADSGSRDSRMVTCTHAIIIISSIIELADN